MDTIYRAITLMVVASPCAVAMAVPAPVVAAIANGARSGVLFKGGVHIENMAEVTTVAFDKTGTLTEGRPRLTDVVAAGNFDEAAVLALAAAIESRSEHPLAAAVLAAAGMRASTTARRPTLGPFRARASRPASMDCPEEAWIGNRRLLTERPTSRPRICSAWRTIWNKRARPSCSSVEARRRSASWPPPTRCGRAWPT